VAFSEASGIAVRRGRWKLWRDRARVLHLYDLHRDPAEETDLAQTLPDTLAPLRTLLTEWKRGLDRPTVPTERPQVPSLDSADVEMLRVLGYME
jgi:arylsulfatase A-like enzyme